MKTICQILLCLLLYSSAPAQQFYLRGEVKDESGTSLPNVTILSLRTGYLYRSGGGGAFGIISSQKTDTFSFSLDGYRKETVAINNENFVTVRLKAQPLSGNSLQRQNRLISLTRGMLKEERNKWLAGDETYSSLVENKFVNANTFPLTGLSLNVDRASYSNIRRFLNMNSLVPPDAVRIEEMLNYFNLNYIAPKPGDCFGIQTQLSSCPWNQQNRLYYINLSARKLDLEALPPTNLVFLIDVSGSMDMPNRLPLLQSSFRLLVNNLRAKDSVAIVVYGGVTGVMLHTTSGADKDSILRAIDNLTPGGSTPGESGVKIAYSIARNHFIKDGNNRVILATDGDFNVGVRTEDELDDLITRHRESGIYLTCLGVGMGNYKDSKIQTLARKGNGNFAYLDSYAEAEKVLLKEFTQTLYTVADDAYMNVTFNPRYVKQYRLIGFDNKMGALNDTSAVVEGGEIGSGYSMTGIFEIEPSQGDTVILEKFADISLRYRHSGDSVLRYFSHNSYYNYQPLSKLDSSYSFSATVALFGQMLRESPFIRHINWNEMLAMAISNARASDKLEQEFITLVQQARVIYSRGKIKKRKKGGNE